MASNDKGQKAVVKKKPQTEDKGGKEEELFVVIEGNFFREVHSGPAESTVVKKEHLNTFLREEVQYEGDAAVFRLGPRVQVETTVTITEVKEGKK